MSAELDFAAWCADFLSAAERSGLHLDMDKQEILMRARAALPASRQFFEEQPDGVVTAVDPDDAAATRTTPAPGAPGQEAAAVQAVGAWSNVRDHGLPPCDGVTVYVGENEAGYMGCFNQVNPDGLTLMGSPEACVAVFSCLRFWRVQDRAGAAVKAVGADPIAFALRWPNDDRLSLSCVFDTEPEAKEYAERCNDSIEIVPLYAALPPSGAGEKTS